MPASTSWRSSSSPTRECSITGRSAGSALRRRIRPRARGWRNSVDIRKPSSRAGFTLRIPSASVSRTVAKLAKASCTSGAPRSARVRCITCTWKTVAARFPVPLRRYSTSDRSAPTGPIVLIVGTFACHRCITATCSWRFAPTPGLSATTGMPRRSSSSAGPTPETMRTFGDASEPALRITSRLARTTPRRPRRSYSTPTARSPSNRIRRTKALVTTVSRSFRAMPRR